MGIQSIIAGISLIVLNKFLKDEDSEIDKYKCLMNYFGSDIFMNISKIYGVIFIIIGILNILTNKTNFEFYSFFISIIMISIFVINVIKGLWKYMKS